MEAEPGPAPRENDAAGVRELLSAHGDRLLRSAFLLCGREADAQDLVQETFLQALRAERRFRNQSSVYTWLHGILLNLSRHYHRDRKRIVYGGEQVEETPADAAENPVALDVPDDRPGAATRHGPTLPPSSRGARPALL